MNKLVAGLFVLVYGLGMMNCTDRKTAVPQTTFTKVDSLTDRYLAYQDSILRCWNVMINDDNQKIKAMHNLLHELLITNVNDRDQLRDFEAQIDNLARLRYTQNSMANVDVVEEYDFASASLVTELITLAESKTEFAYNTTLQRLVDEIRTADQRVNNYRDDYDYIVVKYNNFLARNKSHLPEISHSDSMEQKHLFKMASAD